MVAFRTIGRVAELVDAQDSGSCEVTLVRVQVPPRPPMTYRAYRPDRRFRRRRWLLIIVTLVAVVASIAFLVTRQTEQRGTVEFFAVAHEATEMHATAAVELESAIAAIGVTQRQDLIARFQRISRLAADAHALLDVEVPLAVAASYGSLSTASVSWLSGVAEVERVVLALMNGGAADVATSDLSAAFDELRAGDSAYELFLGSLTEPVEDVDTSSFPPISFVNSSPSDPLLFDALNIVIRVSVSYELAPHHNVGVTGQLEPLPVSDRGGTPLVPFFETFGVIAVITNTGNEVAVDVAVVLEILNVDTNEVQTLNQVVAEIAGGSASSVSFADLSVVPGDLYQVKLVVTIAEDNDPEDNTWTMAFIRNEDA